MERDGKRPRTADELIDVFNHQFALHFSLSQKEATGGPLSTRVPNNVKDMIWLKVVRETGMRFEDAMQMLAGKENGQSDGLFVGSRSRWAPLVDFSDMLARQPEPWKRWFHEDFPLVVKDIGRVVGGGNGELTVEIPGWIETLNDGGGGDPTFNTTRQHSTDRLFAYNSWRRFYVWTRALQRLSSKFIGQIFLEHARENAASPGVIVRHEEVATGLAILTRTELRNSNLTVRENEKLTAKDVGVLADSCVVVQWSAGQSAPMMLNSFLWTRIAFVSPEDPRQKTGALFRKERLSIAPVFLLWIYLRSRYLYTPDYPLRSLDRYSVTDSPLNFELRHAVIAFMLWYLGRMHETGKIPVHYTNVLDISGGGGGGNILQEAHMRHSRLLSGLPMTPRLLQVPVNQTVPFWESTLFLGDGLSSVPPPPPPPPMFRCSRCKLQQYASRDEQIADWPRHLNECAPPPPPPL